LRHPLIAGQPEVVVGAEVEHLALADPDDRALPGGDHPLGLGQALAVDISEFGANAPVEVVGHGVPEIWTRPVTPISRAFPPGRGLIHRLCRRLVMRLIVPVLIALALVAPARAEPVPHEALAAEVAE